MKKIISVFLLVFFLLLIPASNIHASGLTTNQDNQVKLINQDGVVYLSTQAAPSSYRNKNGISITDKQIELPTGFADDLGNLINALLSLVMVIAALLVFLVLILSAFQWITSGGDKGKVDGARSRITASIIGLIIVSASYAILTLVLKFLGFSDLNAVLNSLTTINSSDVKPSYSYTRVCGDSYHQDLKVTQCDKGCNVETGICKSTDPYVARFICDGKQSECTQNGSTFEYSQSFTNVKCNQTVQIDVFDKNCVDGENKWVCNEDNLLDYLVWYSGECKE